MTKITTMVADADQGGEAIAQDLITALDDILCGGPQVAASAKRSGRSARFGLPARRRPAPPTALSAADAARIGAIFDRSVRPLLHAASQRVVPYPTAALRHMNSLANTRPGPGEQIPHLRRLGVAILTVLDLLGDDE